MGGKKAKGAKDTGRREGKRAETVVIIRNVKMISTWLIAEFLWVLSNTRDPNELFNAFRLNSKRKVLVIEIQLASPTAMRPVGAFSAVR